MNKQIRYMAEYFYYYAGMADKVEGQVIPSDKPGVFAYTKNEPKGVVAIITPWNSPLTLTSWKLAPALAAGCTAVIKPSEFTSASMVEFAALFTEAGFPDGVVNVVTGFGNEVGAPLVAIPMSRMSALPAARRRASPFTAGGQGIKTVTLELGGKSPNIVFDDADLDQAVKGAVSGIFAAAGQTCIAGSRLLVQENIHDEFVGRLIDFVKNAKLGDRGLDDTQIGPIATSSNSKRFCPISRSPKRKARSRAGRQGAARSGRRAIYRAHHLHQCRQQDADRPGGSVRARAQRHPFKDVDDAIRIGNDVLYGLAAGVWTKSLDRAMQVSDKLLAGNVWVNNYRATSFTSPFGGFKRSGVGRESGTNAMHRILRGQMRLDLHRSGRPQSLYSPLGANERAS